MFLHNHIIFNWLGDRSRHDSELKVETERKLIMCVHWSAEAPVEGVKATSGDTSGGKKTTTSAIELTAIRHQEHCRL